MAKRGEPEPVVRPPLDAPLCDDAPLEEIALRLCPLTLWPLTLWPLTLWPLVLCVPLVEAGASACEPNEACEVVLDEGGGGGGILAPDKVRPAPRPDWVRDGSDALEFREDVTWAQCDDNVNNAGHEKRNPGALLHYRMLACPLRNDLGGQQTESWRPGSMKARTVCAGGLVPYQVRTCQRTRSERTSQRSSRRTRS